MADEIPLIPHKDTDKPTTSWVSSSSIIVANMLGAGVLGLPFATKSMGLTTTAILLAIITAARYKRNAFLPKRT
jgi:amino acid permease